MTRRLAMWSGPRNISTAMMRAWENRSDTRVVDEPFYACYLQTSGVTHPMRDQVIASQSTDWNEVAGMLADGPVAEPVFYQKHMTHHILDGVDLSWTCGISHCFLIRDPSDVVASYAEKRDSVTSADIGIKRQYELFEQIGHITGRTIPVIDAQRFLEDPERALRALCAVIGIEYAAGMLSWPAGPRDSDGVWAPHWYQSVEASTGFAPYRIRRQSLPPARARVVDESMPFYERLLAIAMA